MIIYKVENMIDGKVYIGKTGKSLEKRWKEHCYDAKRKSSVKRFKLHRAIAEYGAENFSVVQIDTAATKDEADEKEVKWIRHYCATIHGYNTSPGGRNGANYRRIKNVETGEVFDSIAEACKKVGVTPYAIAQALDKPHRKSAGFHWVSV